MEPKETIKDILRPFYQLYQAHANNGHNVTCNICGRSFKRPRPVIGRHADGSTFVIKELVGTCWFCNTYPRMRLLWHRFENELYEARDIKILCSQ